MVIMLMYLDCIICFPFHIIHSSTQFAHRSQQISTLLCFIAVLGYQEDVEPVDLTVTHKGRLWEHEAEECRDLLRSMSELSAAMYNVKGKTNDAIKVHQNENHTEAFFPFIVPVKVADNVIGLTTSPIS